MRALYFLTGDNDIIQEIDIPNTLEAMQEAVGGYIETVTLDKDAVLICNEEGRLRNLRPQTVLGMIFFGNVLLVGVKGDEFTDAPEGILERLERRFA